MSAMTLDMCGGCGWPLDEEGHCETCTPEPWEHAREEVWDE